MRFRLRLAAAGLALAPVFTALVPDPVFAADGPPAAASSLGELEALLQRPVYDSGRLAAASKYEQDLAAAPASVTVRTGGEIRTQGYRTLAEVLESMPGVHGRNDRAYTLTNVRGISRPGDYASRLLVLVDGVRINEPIYDAAATGREFPVDVALIDRVEFIAGPGSALYGTNALMGVVNVVTKNPSQRPGWQAEAEIGSARQRRLSLGWGGELGPVRLLLDASGERRPGRDLHFPEFDTPADGGGVARGRDAEASDKLFVKAAWGDVRLSLVHAERTKLIPTGSFGVIFDTPSPWRDRSSAGNLAWARALDERSQLELLLGAAQYRYDDTGAYGDRAAPITSQSTSEARWLSAELRYQWLGWRDHRVLLGAELQRNARLRLAVADVAPEPLVHSAVRTRNQRQALFVNDAWTVNPALTLALGLRADTGPDRSHRVTPRLSALWTPHSAWSFKLLHGRAFREPNVYETHYDDGSTQRAPERLGIESLRSTELVAQWRPSARWSLRAARYDLKLGQLIELAPQPDGLSMFENRGGARSRGTELEATWQDEAGLQLRASWSRQDATDRDSGATLGDAPRSLLKLAASGTGPWHGARWGVNAVRTGQRLTLAGAAIDSGLAVNAHLRHAPAGQAWWAGFGVYNLTDRRNADPAGPEHVQDRIVQDRRALRLQVGLGF